MLNMENLGQLLVYCQQKIFINVKIQFKTRSFSCSNHVSLYNCYV